MTAAAHPLVGQRVHVSDQHYTGPALVLEYDPTAPAAFARAGIEIAGPFYCHLLDHCDHESCDDPGDDCMGEDCRGWYAIPEEGSAA